jgi:hypothetical protein
MKFQGAANHRQAAIRLAIASKSVFIPNIVRQRLSNSTPITSPPARNLGKAAHYQTPDFTIFRSAKYSKQQNFGVKSNFRLGLYACMNASTSSQIWKTRSPKLKFFQISDIFLQGNEKILRF